jgi:hypothetical protein
MLGSNPDPLLVAEQNKVTPNAPERGEDVLGMGIIPILPEYDIRIIVVIIAAMAI